MFRVAHSIHHDHDLGLVLLAAVAPHPFHLHSCLLAATHPRNRHPSPQILPWIMQHQQQQKHQQQQIVVLL